MRLRTRSEIAALILESAKAGMPKLTIMHNVYVSYTELGYYLTALCQNGLLGTTGYGYKTTPKGLKFLKAYYNNPKSIAFELNQHLYT